MAASDAKPIPQKNVAYRVTFPIYDVNGDLVTGAAGLDSEISKDSGTATDCTNEATEIATSFGLYYLDLTATEMNADTVAIKVKSTTTDSKDAVIIIYPEEVGDIRVNMTAINGDATNGNNATLSLAQLNITNSGDKAMIISGGSTTTPALEIVGTGTNSPGMTIDSNGTGPGIDITVGQAGELAHGINFNLTNSTGNCIDANGPGTGGNFLRTDNLYYGFNFQGVGGSGEGIRIADFAWGFSCDGNDKGIYIQDCTEGIEIASSGVAIKGVSSAGIAVQFTAGGANSGVVITSGSGATGDAVQLTAASTNGGGLVLTGTGTGKDIDATEIDTIDTNVDAILVDTGTTIPAQISALNDLSAAEVNTEVDTALSDIGLNYLISSAVTGANVTDNSIIAYLVSKSATADWDSFNNTTDSLEALSDSVGGTMDANIISIDGQLTNGNNATLYLKALDIQNSSGVGINVAGGGSGNDGVVITGGVNDYAISLRGGSTNGGGLEITCPGLLADKDAVSITSGIIGGKAISAVSTSDSAVLFDSQGSNGHGLELSGDGTGKGIYTVLSEPSVGQPSATPDLEAALAHIFGSWRNKGTATASIKTFHNSSGTALYTKALSDNGTTYTEDGMISA